MISRDEAPASTLTTDRTERHEPAAMLTDRERQLLAELEAQTALSDPRLAARLGGARRRRGRPALTPRVRAAVGIAALVAGLAGTVALVSVSVWLAFGCVVVAFFGAQELAPSAARAGTRLAGRAAATTERHRPR